VVVPLVAAMLTVGACASDKNLPPPGADPAQVGPTISVGGGANLPPDTADATGQPAAAAAEDPLTVLRGRLIAALRVKDPDADAGGLKVEQRKAAENQLIVTWTVSTDPGDRDARKRVRVDIIELLRVVKTVTFAYGTVLCIANGAILDAHGKKIDAQVVRAKYSRALVQRTDFATVGVEQILKLPDDKPAEIVPAYR
jgi:hypothetical protein